jgi:hypothetical protein
MNCSNERQFASSFCRVWLQIHRSRLHGRPYHCRPHEGGCHDQSVHSSVGVVLDRRLHAVNLWSCLRPSISSATLTVWDLRGLVRVSYTAGSHSTSAELSPQYGMQPGVKAVRPAGAPQRSNSKRDPAFRLRKRCSQRCFASQSHFTRVFPTDCRVNAWAW